MFDSSGLAVLISAWKMSSVVLQVNSYSESRMINCFLEDSGLCLNTSLAFRMLFSTCSDNLGLGVSLIANLKLI